MNLAKLKAFALDAKSRIAEKANRMMQGQNLERSAMIVAMVSYLPDSDASQAEVRKGILAMHAMTKDAFSPKEMETKVKTYIAELEADADIGKMTLMRELGRVSNKDDAGFLVDVGIIVGKADGDDGEDPFSDAEKALVAEIARKMGLDPTTFGLD